MSTGRRWTPESTDEALVDAAQHGDRRALDQLLRRHHDRIHLLCRRLCRHQQEAEDATQQALLAIVRGLPSFNRTAAFTTWSYRVASNACLDELRRRARRPLAMEAEEHLLATASIVAGKPGVVIDPAEAAAASERRNELQRALDQLPEAFRLPVVLRDVAEWDYAEIAEQLDLPPGTVRSRIARGRSRLAAILSQDNGNPDGTADVPTGDEP